MVSNTTVTVAYRDGDSKVNIRGFMNDGLENLEQSVSEAPKPASLTQEDVDRIVKSRVAREREKWEATAQQSHLPGAVTGMTPDQVKMAMREEMMSIRQEAEDKAQQAAVHTMANKVVESFNSKMSRGIDKYPDFQEKTSKLPLSKLLPIVQLAEQVDNTEDVMYELANNKGKMGNILSLYRDAPEVAMQAMSELSQSIKANESAKSNTRHSQPLSQVKPSATAVDNGIPSVRDMMKQDWLRR